MYFVSLLLLDISFILALYGAGIVLWDYKGKRTYNNVTMLEQGFNIIIGIYVVISCVLLQSLMMSDFTLVYTASYTNRELPFLYKVTAFWAGQAGSMLFWTNGIIFFAFLFRNSHSYKELSDETKTWYWFFLSVFIAFFAFLIGTWNNPFVIQTPAPQDGAGLNPLLQAVAMIIHPPMLLLGYAGMIIPACVALASSFSTVKESTPWVETVRTSVLLPWMFLSGGIVLGGWWAYMELGWGGYWAWDPVENASFLPWLVSSAYLHTSLVQRYRDKLHRMNLFLITLVALTTIFATYIVRGGIVESVHAFAGTVGTPLLIFVIVGICVLSYIVYATPPQNDNVLDGINSKEALLVLVSWFFLVAAVIITLATLFPVFTRAFADRSIGLDVKFYNDVVLPLFIVITILLSLCYAMTWKQGLRSKKELIMPSVLGIVAIVISYIAGYRQVSALLGIGSAIAMFYTAKIFFFPSQYKFLSRRYIAATLVHLGFGIMVFGIAFSGPFKEEKEIVLKPNQSVMFAGYNVTYTEHEFTTIPEFTYYRAVLQITKDGKDYGVLTPEKRIYPKYESMSFAEASVIPSLYKELYASLLNVQEDNTVFINISVQPFVNWIWIGAIILTFSPIIGLFDRNRKKENRE
ncbi:MAG: cytochrome c biogenesis protein CcsA [Desulfovibrionaceae bacterium]|nr:cytochrome c biogenesis protein CcsA [Desulfovibrionaceae bacterium]